MKEWIEKHGTSDRKALIDYANSLIMHYGEASGAMACELYDSIARASGVTIPSAEPAPIPKYGEVAKAVNGALKVSEKVIPSVVARMTKQVGADTILHNAGRDEKHGAQFAWIATGDSCKFCLMLASRGWQYMSKNALKNGHAEHIHGNCDCQYAIRFDGKSIVNNKKSEEQDGGISDISDTRNRQLLFDDKETLLERRNKTFVTYLAKESKYGICVSNNATLKKQGLENIEKSIDKALQLMLSKNIKSLPKIYVLSTEEMGEGVFASYNYIKNEMYLSDILGNKKETIIQQHFYGFANPKKEYSTILHELLHWDDAIIYVKKYGQITKENKKQYLQYLQKRAKIILDKEKIDFSNIRNICKYARDSYLIDDYDEAYTEYRVSKMG